MESGELETRFTYHPPKGNQAERYTILRDQAKTFAQCIGALCPESREKSLAITNLEQAVMWANSAIARREGSEGNVPIKQTSGDVSVVTEFARRFIRGSCAGEINEVLAGEPASRAFRSADDLEFKTYRKNVPTRFARIEGPFIVETSEGQLRCADGFLGIDARGYPYPVAADEHALIYSEVPDPDAALAGDV